MTSLAHNDVADIRAKSLTIEDDRLVVELMDGRAIAAPLAWYPRLANATAEQRSNWKISGAGLGIHWPDIDEDLSTEGLLRGAPAPRWDAA
ncbi:MAG: DUF2442 domain-containing protein [Alphaproteobacteria bacterium]|uniref:DUF2442 domain-containing protein n=1 Tax=Brevundimonas sp. TaxID=1871086 RepID=UPI0012027DA8|nr:DUF2442 domain-containing protein [Brevundimonas sp.]MBU3970912.1 DUF2442 domain-containing protein [Alphaproteobacteria bacterium]MBA3049456.1 DUF2442 domain-containing protein [Brevundimonas sp.]MBU3974133.1 DUF2442 domain-containing protein [Alphaproteobacteria bacterium]MBU4040916.1 DUF2442 domain-containing protein [Alphaproteobacteria bacterium]MBU4136680.1 DUF2442 domain-containing protein [Alphaproteobacteria bacterium]